MTKSNNEWVPEVGQFVLQFFRTIKYPQQWWEVEIIARKGKNIIGWSEYLQNCLVGTVEDGDFKQIKTEAEKRRDELAESMRLDIISLWNYEGKDCPINDFQLSRYLIKQNWIKPKTLTDDQIDSKAEAHIGGVNFEHYSCFRDGARWARDTMEEPE